LTHRSEDINKKRSFDNIYFTYWFTAVSRAFASAMRERI